MKKISGISFILIAALMPLGEASAQTTSAPTGCVAIVRTLMFGSRGSDVSALQRFLAADPAVYPEGIISGFFGSLTERAIQRWQTAHGIVSNGSPVATGWGVVGPRTRAAMNICTSYSGGSTSGSTSFTPGDHTGSIMSGGRTRTYVLHIPTGYSSDKTYPLVLLFHGGLGTGEKILSQTNFTPKSDSAGFILVAPDGIENSWNDGRGTTDAGAQGVDDVAFVRQLVSHLESQLPIDRNRIYATGPSNGGMMTYRLGCEAADLFAAIGPDAANLPVPLSSTCHPQSIPIVAINGLADPLVPYAGGRCCGNADGAFGLGQGGEILSTIDTLEIFAGANGCSSTYTPETLPFVVNDGTSVEKRVYNNCPAGFEVVSYAVAGMGHGWPPYGGRVPRISGPASGNIRATDVVWDFFSQHHK